MSEWTTYLWPHLVGGTHDGESVLAGQVEGRGWLHIPNQTGGTSFYWPMPIALSRDDNADRLLVYVDTDEGGEAVAARVVGLLARAAGCEVLS